MYTSVYVYLLIVTRTTRRKWLTCWITARYSTVPIVIVPRRCPGKISLYHVFPSYHVIDDLSIVGIIVLCERIALTRVMI